MSTETDRITVRVAYTVEITTDDTVVAVQGAISNVSTAIEQAGGRLVGPPLIDDED